MSIVAVKVENGLIQIASDSIVVRHSTQDKSSNNFSKLNKINSLILGSTGSAEEISLFRVFCSTRRPEQTSEMGIISFLSEFATWKGDRTGDAFIQGEHIIIVDNKVFAIEGFFVEEITNFTAIGAGMDYALTALHLGHNVEKAVEVACELSVYCELPVKMYQVCK